MKHSLCVPLLLCGMLVCAGCRPETSQPVEPVATKSNENAEQSAPENKSESAPLLADIPQDDFQPEEGFKLLTLKDFDEFSAEPSTWDMMGTSLVSTGKPKGYIRSKESFQNFDLKLEFRFLLQADLPEEKKSDSNTGILVYIAPEDKIWPVCLEVQGKHVEMASIKANGGAAELVIEDSPEKRKVTRKPVGEWNILEVQSRDGKLTSLLNGNTICTSEAGELNTGSIGLQAEGFPLEFRRIRISTEVE